MRFEEKKVLSTFGEGFFILGLTAFLLLVMSPNSYTDSLFGLQMFMLGFLVFFACLIASGLLVHFGTGYYYFPAFGFFRHGILDERESALSAKATQLSTWALFMYASIIMLFFPSSLTVSQALFGALIVHLGFSWLAFQAFLYYFVPR